MKVKELQKWLSNVSEELEVEVRVYEHEVLRTRIGSIVKIEVHHTGETSRCVVNCEKFGTNEV